MKILEFLDCKLFNLPINYSGDFLQFIKKLLIKDYFNEIIRSLLLELDLFKWNEPKELILSKQGRIVHGLIDSIELYLQGKPNSAYNRFSETMIYGGSEFTGLNYYVSIRGTAFYRIRIQPENDSISELFHIPFEKRGKVKSQRFSIPGVPSLYLSDSLYTCWKELHCPPIEDIHFIKSNPKPELKFFNLRFHPEEAVLGGEKVVFNQFMKWPIVALCSIKVKNPDDSFKPEYIIPQLLYEWIRNNKELDGIIYDSTHIDVHNSHHKGSFRNIVLSPKNYKEKGHCSFLAKSFKSTMPLSISKILMLERNFRALNSQTFSTHLDSMVVQSESSICEDYVNYRNTLLCMMENYAYKFPQKDIFDYLHSH